MKETQSNEGYICLWVYSRRSGWWNLWVTAPSTPTTFIKLGSSSTTTSGKDWKSSELPWMGEKNIVFCDCSCIQSGVSRFLLSLQHIHKFQNGRTKSTAQTYFSIFCRFPTRNLCIGYTVRIQYFNLFYKDLYGLGNKKKSNKTAQQ